MTLSIIIFCILLNSRRLQAYSNDSGYTKNEIITTIFILDPIPGDALLYSGRYIQGTVNAVLGTTGGVFFFYGIFKSCPPGDPNNEGLDKAFCSMGRGLVALGGGLLYFPMLIWDAIGGFNYLGELQAELPIQHEESFSLIDRIRPVFSVEPSGVFGGISFQLD